MPELPTRRQSWGTIRSVALEHELIDVAPHPGFAGLEGTDDGVFDGVKMFGGVLVLGTVTTADISARQTQAQMDPSVSHLQAFFAALGLGFDGTNLISVRTNFSHAASCALKPRV
jgi:hypothetical protein